MKYIGWFIHGFKGGLLLCQDYEEKATHRSLMPHPGPVPHHPGHPALADHLPAGIDNPRALLLTLGFVVSRQGTRDPVVGVGVALV
jgi:hypothetical protein